MAKSRIAGRLGANAVAHLELEVPSQIESDMVPRQRADAELPSDEYEDDRRVGKGRAAKVRRTGKDTEAAPWQRAVDEMLRRYERTVGPSSDSDADSDAVEQLHGLFQQPAVEDGEENDGPDRSGGDDETGVHRTDSERSNRTERRIEKSGVHRVADDDDDGPGVRTRPQEDTGIHKVDDDDDDDDKPKVRQVVIQAAVAQMVNDTRRRLASRRKATQARKRQERVDAKVRVEHVVAEEVPLLGELDMAEAQQASDGRLAELRTKLRSLRAERIRYVVVEDA